MRIPPRGESGSRALLNLGLTGRCANVSSASVRVVRHSLEPLSKMAEMCHQGTLAQLDSGLESDDRLRPLHLGRDIRSEQIYTFADQRFSPLSRDTVEHRRLPGMVTGE